MHTVTKPDQTMLIVFEDNEWEIVEGMAKLKEVTPNFLIAICLQTVIRNISDIFPRKLLMPGYMDRELEKRKSGYCHRCHQTEVENKKNG